VGAEAIREGAALAFVEGLIEAPAADREQYGLQRFAAAREGVLRCSSRL